MVHGIYSCFQTSSLRAEQVWPPHIYWRAEVLPPAEVEVVRVRTAAAESWQGGGIILIKLH